MNSVQGGLQMVYKFDNGYGASVIQHEGSYGSHKGRWELAVLCHGELCYDHILLTTYWDIYHGQM